MNEAEGPKRAHLKIFLGSAPGVGKTFAMLEAAQVRRQEGVDVVAGIIETHTRPETAELSAGIDVLPRRQVEYRGRTLQELDLDTLLARQPSLALVDELAHSNAPGSRHPKRYLDIQEILDAGIDVYTTVNIQHLESLNDVVAQITGVRVRETIPDWLLERADEVEVIDLSPEALLQRLREGKVYVPDQVEEATRRFFRPGNLSALRELALRRTAERVDDQMQTYMQAHAIPGPWPAGELIMVCISANPMSAQLVRAARRMAERRRARWLAAYVETPAHYRLSDAERDQVARTLRLAEQLGAEVVRIPGANVAPDLVHFARSRNVTELIIGKSLRSRWHELWRGSIVHDVIRRSGKIDVYVITGETEAWPGPARPRGSQIVRDLGAYAVSTLLVAAIALLAKILQSFLPLPDLSIIFLAAVLISALRWGLGPSIYTAFLSVLSYDYFFVYPVHTLSVASPEDLLALVAFLGVAALTSNLAARIRAQADASRQRENRTAALYALSQQVARAADLESVLQAVVGQVDQILNVLALVLLPQGDQVVVAAASHPDTTLNDHEQAAAMWAWQRGQPAGRASDTLAGVDWLFLPLITAHGTVGVLGVQPRPALVGGIPGETGSELAPDERRLLEALAGQAAVAIERANLALGMAQARVLTETERLRTALLSSISHDLRTPLASIIGAVTSLLDYGTVYDEAARGELLATIQEEAERLDHFVGNLLDMTRLESGALQLKREWVEPEDLIGAALARLAARLSQHHILVDVQPRLPLIQVDFVLMEQVLVNLLDNAARYAPAETTIYVTARQADGAVVMEVADQGPGVPPDDLERIFDKFYRVRHGDSQSAGTGLGLSICRGFVEAHGGCIVAQARTDGPGTIFMIELPVTNAPGEPAQSEATHE
jgi:two-component system, OmpR family, sensor histidine kinase KdpD